MSAVNALLATIDGDLAVVTRAIGDMSSALAVATIERDQLRAARYVLTLDDPLDVVQVPPDCLGCNEPTFDTDVEGEPLCAGCAEAMEPTDDVDVVCGSAPVEPVYVPPPFITIPVEPATQNDQELHPQADEGVGLQQSSDADASTSGGQPGGAPDTTPPTWEDIAALWISATRAGVSPNEVMSVQTGRPVSTVRNWPTRLRSQNLIPPVGVDLDDWEAANAATKPAPAPPAAVVAPPPATDSPGITDDTQVGYACEQRGCKFTAPAGITGRSDIRSHTLNTHGRKPSAMELAAGVIE